MIAPFAEAIRATVQPCSLLLVVPPLAAVLVTGSRWAPFLAAMVGAILGGWLFMGNVVSLTGWPLRMSGVAVFIALALIAGELRTPRLTWAADNRAQAVAAGSVAFIATMWWRPCVGTELGKILSGARTGMAGQLAPMAAYMLGAMVPVALAVCVFRAMTPTEHTMRWTARSATAVGGITALAMAAGRHEQLVSTLTGWSSA